jgi:hypothetical protein
MHEASAALGLLDFASRHRSFDDFNAVAAGLPLPPSDDMTSRAGFLAKQLSFLPADVFVCILVSRGRSLGRCHYFIFFTAVTSTKYGLWALANHLVYFPLARCSLFDIG